MFCITLTHLKQKQKIKNLNKTHNTKLDTIEIQFRILLNFLLALNLIIYIYIYIYGYYKILPMLR